MLLTIISLAPPKSRSARSSIEIPLVETQRKSEVNYNIEPMDMTAGEQHSSEDESSAITGSYLYL